MLLEAQAVLGGAGRVASWPWIGVEATALSKEATSWVVAAADVMVVDYRACGLGRGSCGLGGLSHGPCGLVAVARVVAADAGQRGNEPCDQGSLAAGWRGNGPHGRGGGV